MDEPAKSRLTEAEIITRLPLWSAFADLFLDTAVTRSYPYIARVLLESPFTRAQGWQILWCEGTPAFIPNLSLVAGNWTGWDDPYIRQVILRRLGSARWFWRLTAPRQGGFAYKYALEHWQAIQSLLPPEIP